MSRLGYRAGNFSKLFYVNVLQLASMFVELNANRNLIRSELQYPMCLGRLAKLN